MSRTSKTHKPAEFIVDGKAVAYCCEHRDGKRNVYVGTDRRAIYFGVDHLRFLRWLERAVAWAEDKSR